MKTYIQKFAKLILLTVFITGAFSLKSFAGGDAYEIYLNNKLVYKYVQFSKINGLNDLHLDKLSANDKLVIKYSHCGEQGKNRSIVIKDENNKILKEWKFTDAENNKSVMVISVKELLELKEKNSIIKLFYSAKQLPEGKMLASLSLNKKSVAQNSRAIK